MNDPAHRSWETLAAKARAAAPPEIDIRHAVAASLQPRHTQPTAGFAESLLALSDHWGFRVAFGVSTLFAAAIAYGGYKASEDFSMLVSLTF